MRLTSELSILPTFGPVAFSCYGVVQWREIYASFLYLVQRERISCRSTVVIGRRWGGGNENERVVVQG
jgi:hypothetical protein